MPFLHCCSCALKYPAPRHPPSNAVHGQQRCSHAAFSPQPLPDAEQCLSPTALLQACTHDVLCGFQRMLSISHTISKTITLQPRSALSQDCVYYSFQPSRHYLAFSLLPWKSTHCKAHNSRVPQGATPEDSVCILTDSSFSDGKQE